MSEETLLSAARRVLRLFRIDEAHGSLISIPTLQAMDTLDFQISKENKRLSQLAKTDALVTEQLAPPEIGPTRAT